MTDCPSLVVTARIIEVCRVNIQKIWQGKWLLFGLKSLPECDVAAIDISLQWSPSSKKPGAAFIIAVGVDCRHIALLFKRRKGLLVCIATRCAKCNPPFWNHCRLEKITGSKVPKEDLTKTRANCEDVAVEGHAAHSVTQLLRFDRPH